jgi:ABC-2 type transport system ATP-binding protein
MSSTSSAAVARRVAAGIAVAGAVGLGLLAIPAGAGAAPELPPVTPEDLVSSVLTAQPGAFDGTVEVDNALGLPALPNLPQAANGTSSARIWSDGQGRGRIQLPTSSGERTLVSDGTTFWAWNSEDATVQKAPAGDKDKAPAGRAEALADPTAAATQALQALRASSDVRVDGTAEVADRAAYELVLTPAASERTLLREVRLAVDAEKRVPLRLTVLANGSTDPALQIGFTDLDFGQQDPAMFTFTPPPGATVEPAPAPDAQQHARPEGSAGPDDRRRRVGHRGHRVGLPVGRRPERPEERGRPEGRPVRAGHPGQRVVGTRDTDQHRGGQRHRHRRRADRRGRGAGAGAHRGPRQVTEAVLTAAGSGADGLPAAPELAARAVGLRKVFGSTVAVDGVDLDVPAGSVLGMLGPNGSGKTTLIRMLLGLTRPTAGSAELLGHPVDTDAAGALPHVGALVEGPGFHPFLSGRANLARVAAAEPLLATADIAAVVDAALERVGLAGAAHRRYRGYSLGMKQRLGLAAALLVPRRLVVLDEPTNGLDPAGTRDVRRIIGELHADGATVVVSSHLLAEVEATCTHVAVLQSGTLVAAGELRSLLETGGAGLLVATPGRRGGTAHAARSRRHRLPHRGRRGRRPGRATGPGGGRAAGPGRRRGARGPAQPGQPGGPVRPAHRRTPAMRGQQ